MRILIVEDQEDMLRSLCEFLQSVYPASTILRACTAAEAMRTSRTHRPDLVLMDVQLPDANGIAVTAEVKIVLPESIVIVVSQHSARTYVERAQAAGAFAFVDKGRVYHDLLPAIERALETTPRAGSC